jgi:hypothetical protein
MKTAEHYRALAEECIKWADEAYTNEVRGSYSSRAFGSILPLDLATYP